MRKACLILGGVVLAAAAGAKETTFTGTGTWNTAARWNNGVPGADDTAIVSGNGATVTADGLDVIFNTLKLGNASSHSVTYRQKGGTFTSGYLTEVGLNGAAAETELENVDVALNAYRLVVGRGGDARFAMVGGTLTQNLSASNAGLLTSVWGKGGVAEIVLSNVVWNVNGGQVQLGYGSVATSRLEVVGGRIDGKVQFRLGANKNNFSDPRYGWNEMVVQDSVWTNTAAVFMPPAQNQNARLLVSNTVLHMAATSIRVAGVQGTTGTVEFADCTDLTIGDNIWMAEGANTNARLVLRNQSNVADFLANKVNYKNGAGSETWIELINSPYTPSATWQIGTSTSYKRGVVIRDATYANPSGNTTAAHGGLGHLVFSNATVNISRDLSAADDIAGGTGVVEFVDSKLILYPDCDTNAWQQGKSATMRRLYVSNHAQSWGRVRFSGGEADINSFMVPRQGYGEARIENGADVRVGGLWVANMTGCSGVLRITDTARIHAQGRITVCNQSSSTGRVEQTGGTVLFDASHSPAEAGSDSGPSGILIGCADGASGYWRISGGSLTLPSNAISLGSANGGYGVFELAGGTVTTPRFYKSSSTTGTAIVLFDGGTFKIYPSTYIDMMNPSMTAEVRAGGAIIDTDGSSKNFGAVLAHDSRAGAAAKDGGIVKKGAGTLTVTSTPTFTGDVRVEAGTLDLSGTSFALGADAAIGGGGTLVPPSGGLTVTGAFTLDPTNAPTLTVSGPVTIGAGATVAVTDASLLNQKTSYRLYTATATSGALELVGFPRGWMAVNDGTSLRVLYASGTTIIFR